VIVLRRIHGLSARERRIRRIVLLLLFVPAMVTILISIYINHPFSAP